MLWMIGMRIDGRKNDEIRKINIVPNVQTQAKGSVMIEMGKTKVLCSASVIEEAPPFLEEGEGWVTAEYSMLPGSSPERIFRERKGVKGRTKEIERLIGRSLRSIIDLKKLGPRTIWIDCDVIQADGGTRCASIDGGYLALCYAVKKLMDEGLVTKNPINGFIGAISIGKIKDDFLVDMCYEEDVNTDMDMNIVMVNGDRFVEIQGTAEHKTF